MARFATTSTPLAGAGSWDTGALLSDVFDTVTGSVFADQAGTIFIEQTADPRAADPATVSAAVWDISTSYAVPASNGKGFDEKLLLPYFRVRYVNGATIQGAFRLTARAEAAGNRY